MQAWESSAVALVGTQMYRAESRMWQKVPLCTLLVSVAALKKQKAREEERSRGMGMMQKLKTAPFFSSWEVT